MNSSALNANPDPPAGGNPGWNKVFSKAGVFLSDKPFLASFLAVLLLAVTILSLFRPYFQYCDDNFLLLSLQGTGLNWAPSEFNHVQNVLLSLFLKNLYVGFPDIQWYSCFLVFSQFLSLWGILAALQMGSHRAFKTFLFILGSAVLDVHFFTNIQWTLTAASAGIGAFLLLAAVWRKEDPKPLWPALSLALILILITVLIRDTTVLLIALASVPAVVYLSRKTRMTPARRSILWLLTAAAVLSMALIAFHHHYYFKDRGWGDSARFLYLHNELEDYRKPVYNETTKPFFDSIGWTANDLDLFKSWYFMDPDTYSCENLKKLNDYFPKFAFGKNDEASFAAIFSMPMTHVAVLFFLTMLFFLPPRPSASCWRTPPGPSWSLFFSCCT